jgi:hypothetical protein
MPPIFRRSTIVLTLLAVTLSVFGLSIGVASSLELLGSGLTAAAAPPLLAPITEAGRAGWTCIAEQAARATHWREAELPPP